MKITKETAQKIIDRLNKSEKNSHLSTWHRGVYDYAKWSLQPVIDGETDEERNYRSIKEYFLNGSDDFKGLSYGGNYYIYDEDIAKALAAPSERRYSKRTGQILNPNKFENWLDVQKRALFQAYCLVRYFYTELRDSGEVK